jgi:hypothetical protein
MFARYGRPPMIWGFQRGTPGRWLPVYWRKGSNTVVGSTSSGFDPERVHWHVRLYLLGTPAGVVVFQGAADQR